MNYFSIYNRRYLGSKRAILPHITGIVKNLDYSVRTAADLFAGTGMVGGELAEAGIDVTFNDILTSNRHAHIAFYGSGIYDLKKLETIVAALNDIEIDSIKENYFSKNFSDTYFSHSNCLLIGHYREVIEELAVAHKISDREKSILITSLIYGMDKTAATVGHYDAFRIGKATKQRIIFGLPQIPEISSRSTVISQDANQVAMNREWDLVYLDPPYNSRQYGDMYHLLENVAEWKQLPVKYKARKIDRSHLKSDYCTSQALRAFKSLIDSLNTRYILFSYNDTGDRGNSRSAARLTDLEIVSVLEQKGKVTVINLSHKGFTTGKSKIGDIQERIFLCEVRDSLIVDKSQHITTSLFSLETVSASEGSILTQKPPEIIKTPLNYTGNKNKLIQKIKPYFPPASEKSRFVDLFAGGLSVGLNSGYQNLVINDISQAVTTLANLFRGCSYYDVESAVEEIIKDYSLSRSSYFGYEYYGANSSNGLGKYNKQQYINLRNKFNSLEVDDPIYPFHLFTLLIYSFNNQIRFNSSGKFNMPVGKRDFNNRVKKNLFDTINRFSNLGVDIYNKNYQELSFTADDFLYCDPPYTLGLASYNEQVGWSFEDDIALGEYLVRHHQNGGFFALSNVLLHKGKRNDWLKKWSEENSFKVIEINHSYGNSSYHRKTRDESLEALVTNWI